MMELIIFDLDGTIIDSAKDICNALNHSLRGIRTGALTVKQTTRLIGEGVHRLIEKVVPDELSDHRGRVLSEFLSYYTDHLLDNTKLYPHVKETLQKLDRIRKAIVSNKRETLSRKILEGLEISDLFDDILGSDSVSEKKPSPMPILHLLEKYSLLSSQCLIIGDSKYDILAGRSAGIVTVGVTYGYGDRSALKEADHIIDDIRELPPLMDR
ncbi:MAG: HAD-IA family hydrolase [Nitrospirota bacterium]|nr:MAG: HAD-IA family hydrolase [Nitrospirota bacterium]